MRDIMRDIKQCMIDMSRTGAREVVTFQPARAGCEWSDFQPAIFCSQNIGRNVDQCIGDMLSGARTNLEGTVGEGGEDQCRGDRLLLISKIVILARLSRPLITALRSGSCLLHVYKVREQITSTQLISVQTKALIKLYQVSRMFPCHFPPSDDQPWI